MLAEVAVDTTTVLLIEDNPADADLIAEALEEIGPSGDGRTRFEMVRATRLAEGLARLTAPASGSPGIGVVLLDLTLPDSQGFETFARVRAATPDVPIVVLSGLTDEALAIRTVREGAQEYLVKGEVEGRVLARSLRYAIERKQAEIEHAALVREQAARREVETLAAQRTAILAQTTEGIIVADAGGQITFVNEAARAICGIDPNVLSADGASTRQALSLDDLAAPDLPLGRAIHRGETVVNERWRLTRADGAEIVAEGSATPLRGEFGERLGAVLVLRDVTERQALEEEKDAFLAAASHDLKNPLTSVRGVAQLLQRQVTRAETIDRERLTAGLASIVAAADQMRDQIDEMLDVARLRMGRPLQLAPAPTDLVALATTAAQAHQQTTDLHAISVVAREPEMVGRWDARRIERVLENLLGNAIKYSPGGGEITIELRREWDATGDRAVVSVTDRGIGIPAADVPRLFDRFHRASNVAEQFAGSGLGLSSARQIIEQHGGTIAVESQEGRGSTFTVRLPFAGPPDQAAAPTDSR